MQSFLRDIRYSLRVLAKSQGSVATALPTLALGLGANAASFRIPFKRLFPAIGGPAA